MTITRSQILPLLADACPPYRADFDRFRTEFADDERFVYIGFTEFARCLSRAMAARDEQTMRSVFDLLERFITEGDAEVQEAAVVGIIKNLQNVNLHDKTTPDDYLPFLRPESQHWWGRVKGFWVNGRLMNED
jgi:hypothetical protein